MRMAGLSWLSDLHRAFHGRVHPRRHKQNWLCYKAAMKTALILLLASAPALSCDWTVTKTVDPMTDKTMCRVTSPTAKVTFYKYADERPNVVVVSAYKKYGLQIRIDDNEAVWMGENFPSRMRAMDTLLPQLQGATRIRTSFRDYPDNQAGDAPVCNLPELLASC